MAHFHLLASRQDKVNVLLEAVYHQNLPYLTIICATVFILRIVLYFQDENTAWSKFQELLKISLNVYLREAIYE